MFVGAGMPSILGPTPKKNVRKYPGKEGKARRAIFRGAPATITAPEITVMTAAHAALVTDVFIATLPSPVHILGACGRAGQAAFLHACTTIGD
jgi:hypothetical protein